MKGVASGEVCVRKSSAVDALESGKASMQPLRLRATYAVIEAALGNRQIS